MQTIAAVVLSALFRQWGRQEPPISGTGVTKNFKPCGPKSHICCNPSIVPDQMCPFGIPCEPCGGGNACECPGAPGPSPSPSPTPTTRLTVVNGCKNPMWIAHIDEGGLGPDPQDVMVMPGGRVQQHTSVRGGGLSATRFWPKLGCDSRGTNCTVGSSGGPAEGCVVRVPGRGDDYSRCAPPVDTKFEATFATPGSGTQDVVDMSLVDGYTLPFKLEVHGGSCTRSKQPFNGMDCSGLSMDHCPTVELLDNTSENLNAVNPKTGDQGGCYSPCMKLTDDKWNPAGSAVAPDSRTAGQYCCAGAWGSPGACNAGTILKTNYLKTVKEACPAAYGYAYDDKTSTIACTTSTEYTLTFYCLS